MAVESSMRGEYSYSCLRVVPTVSAEEIRRVGSAVMGMEPSTVMVVDSHRVKSMAAAGFAVRVMERGVPE